MREDGAIQNPSAPGECPEPDVIGQNPNIERLEAILGEYGRQSISTPEVVKLKRIDAISLPPSSTMHSALQPEIAISKESKRLFSVVPESSQELNRMVA